ncbi:hypothetical protein MJ579_27235 [Klebsiella pneumoniae]|nr:hypothetical protein MJ579_27235 [Klebsiella pneumoniae]
MLGYLLYRRDGIACAGMESMKAVGRTGAVALLYFEVVSTIALIIRSDYRQRGAAGRPG